MMPKNTLDRLPGILSCLISIEDGGRSLAHCLDIDVLASGSSADEAFRRLTSVVKTHIEFCVKNNNLEGFKRRAKNEEWNMFHEAMRNSNQPPLLQEIDIEIETPLPEELGIPIWLMARTNGRDEAITI